MATVTSNAFNLEVVPFGQGDVFVISGSGFGTKASSTPFLHFDGDTEITFDATSGTDSGYAASGYRSVTTPRAVNHPKFWKARRDTSPLNIYLLTNVTPDYTASVPNDFYMSHYYRADPDWADGGDDDQYKPFTFGRDTGYDIPYWYVGYDGLNFAAGTKVGEYRTGGTYPSTGGFGSNAFNPINGWVRIEIELRLTDQATGRLKIWETSTAGARTLVQDETGATDWGSATQSYLMLGGYVRDAGADNYMYHTDVFIDEGFNRVVLTDNATYGAGSYCEPQPYTAWSDTSITINLNVGGIPAGTAYLHVLDDDGSVIQFGGNDYYQAIEVA